MSLRFTAVLLTLAACDGGGNGDTDTGDTDTGTVREFSYFVNTQTAYTGDATCLGTDLGTVDPAKQISATLNGEVHDFQYDDETVPDADVHFWLGDDITTAPDSQMVTGSNGEFTTTVPMCTPIGYGTFTDPLLELTVDTYEVHQVYAYEEDGVLDEWVNSVSEVTAKLIPGIIGIEWDRTTGIIAGTAYDCNEDPIGHAQVYVHDADGNAPATGEIFYFNSGDLPEEKAKQPDSHEENGLWVAVNIPVGTWTVEMWVWNGTEHQKLGSTQLTIKAGSVNISNIYTGDDDGIAYPDSCLLGQ